MSCFIKFNNKLDQFVINTWSIVLQFNSLSKVIPKYLQTETLLSSVLLMIKIILFVILKFGVVAWRNVVYSVD